MAIAVIAHEGVRTRVVRPVMVVTPLDVVSATTVIGVVAVAVPVAGSDSKSDDRSAMTPPWARIPIPTMVVAIGTVPIPISLAMHSAVVVEPPLEVAVRHFNYRAGILDGN
jgi:hypothetical protein